MREAVIQRDIESELGALHDLLLMRNSSGRARFVSEETGKEFFVPFGLGGPGSPDLVGILMPTGRVVGLEVKQPGGRPEKHQIRVHTLWRKFGAFVATVTTVDEAVQAVERARRGERE